MNKELTNIANKIAQLLQDEGYVKADDLKVIEKKEGGREFAQKYLLIRYGVDYPLGTISSYVQQTRINPSQIKQMSKIKKYVFSQESLDEDWKNSFLPLNLRGSDSEKPPLVHETPHSES